MTIRSIMEHLLAADAIEVKANKEPIFNLKFQNYIVEYFGMNRGDLHSLQSWHHMLSSFSSELEQLQESEIRTIIKLLVYQGEAASCSASI